MNDHSKDKTVKKPMWAVGVREELDRRYAECDADGHKKLEGNFCFYCHRQNKYAISDELDSKIDSFKQETGKLPRMKRPMTGGYWVDKSYQDIQFQKLLDRLKGMSAIEKELYPELIKE